MAIFAKLGLYLLGICAILFAGRTAPQTPLAPVPPPVVEMPMITATSTSTVVAEKEAPKPLPPKPAAVVAVKPPVLPILPPPVPVLTPALPAPAPPAVSWNEINEKTRAALVNIICTTKRGGSFRPVSGSGVVIDPRGVILTNAHVAEYFLLKDHLVPDYIECVIRTGAPAVNAYRTRLLYISPQWIEQNAATITEGEALGTGENDFALLLIETSTRPDTPLPTAFPFIPVDWSGEALKEKGATVLVAAYPAGFLGGITIQKDLNPLSSIATLGMLYSFGEGHHPDLLTIRGSPLAQAGASGGAVVGQKGELLGIIATASLGGTTGERELHAITGAHLERSFAERNKFSIQEMLADADLAHLADEFNSTVVPKLTALLEKAIAP